MKKKKSKVGVGYFIKEGIGSVFTHGFMSFASVCIIIACLLIMGTFSLVALNINDIIKDLESENEIVAYVDDTYTEEQAKALQSKLETVDNVTSVEFVSRDTAMDDFKASYDSSLFDGLDSSVLRDRYIVYLEDISLMSSTQAALSNISGIAKVSAHLDIAKGFITVRNVVSVVSLIIVVILLIVSLFIMSNTVKLTTFDRRDEIAIMKMVGATNGFIRWPFVVEGMFLGLLGSLVAFVLQWGVYELIAGRISNMSLVSIITVIPFGAISLPLLAVFVGIGLLVGIGGSLVAIRNYLKV